MIETEFGNLNYQAQVTARLKNSTFFVSDAEIHQNRISREEAQSRARRQDEYMAQQDMIFIEGYIGPDPSFRTGSRMMIEKTQANIDGMQSQLYFPPRGGLAAGVQDDFVALMPGGSIHTSENGCFAKTCGLDPGDEPTIYGGTTRSDAWLENVAVAADGQVDFLDTSYAANGRSTFPLANIEHRAPVGVPPARYLLILRPRAAPAPTAECSPIPAIRV